MTEPMFSDLAGPGSHILLIGSAHHVTGSLLPDLPSVATTLDDLSQTLVDRCGTPAEQITTVLDPKDPIALANAVEQAAERAGDVFLLYYAGHGVLDSDGALHLATRATVDLARGRAGHQALAFTEVTAILRERCQVRRIVTVVDACHAGRASVPRAAELHVAFDRAGQGSCLLASASRDEHALAPPGARRTAFTGALIDLLNDGDPAVGPQLSVDVAVRTLGRQLPARGMPAPRWWAVDQIGDLVLADNPAYQPPATAAVKPPAGPELSEGGRPVCPYPGLRAFTQGESRFFHGRTDLVASLVDRVQARAETGGGLLFVVGPSGSGKSSLIRAGLLSALACGQAAHGTSSRWPTLTLTPGSDPVGALAEVLAGPVLTTPERLRDQLTNEPVSLPELLRTVHPRSRGEDESRLILIVDQFEELFASGQDATAQQAFVAALTAAAGQDTGSGPAAVVVAVMRADFVGHASAFPELAEALGQDLLAIGAMSRPQVRTAIEKPAQLAGLALDDGLADLILADLGADQRRAYNPGALPLLGHALYETWRRRTGRVLTVAAYRDAGSIGGALADTAEAIHTGFAPAEQALCRRVFVRLVNPEDHTRRTVPRDSLLAPDPQVAGTVLDQLTRARLLTVGHGSRDEDTVTITHEALIDNWPRLRTWINEDQQLERVTQDIEPDARRWQRSASSDQPAPRRLRRIFSSPAADLLYSDQRLAGVEGRLGGHAPTDPVVDTFLAASRHAARRRRRGRLAGLTGLVLLVVVSVITASIAFVQYDNANGQKRRAIARGLVAQAETLRANDPHTALQLDVAADHLNSTSETRAGITSTLVGGYRQQPLNTPSGSVQSVAFSPVGHLLAVTSEVTNENVNKVTLWNVADEAAPRKLGRPLTVPDAATSSVAFSGDGRLLAVGSALTTADGRVWLWDVAVPDKPRRLGKPLTTPGRSVDSLVFSPKERTLAAVGSANTSDAEDSPVTLWDLKAPKTPRQLPRLPPTDGEINSVAFSRDGRTLAAAADVGDDASEDEGTIMLWDMTEPKKPRRIGTPLTTPHGLYEAAFSPDGHTLAALGAADEDSNANRVTLWDVTEPKKPHRLGTPLTTPEGNLEALAFSPDGRTLATAQGNLAAGQSHNTVALWDMADREAPRTLGDPLTAPDSVSSLAFSPDRQTLAVGGDSNSLHKGGEVARWDVAGRAAPRKLSRPLPTEPDDETSLTFSPSGRSLAVTGNNDSTDNTTTLWDLKNPKNPRKAVKSLVVRGDRSSATFSPDGRTLATNGGDRATDGAAMSLWDMTDPERPNPIGKPFTVHNGDVGPLVFSPRGHTLAQAGYDFDSYKGAVTLWDVNGRKTPHRLGTPLSTADDGADSLVFSPDGGTLAVTYAGMEEDTMVLWDVTNPAAPHRLHTVPDGEVGPLVFSPRGHTLAQAGYDFGARKATVTLWDVNGRKAPHRLGKPLSVPGGPANSLVFSRDGRTLAAGCDDGTVRLWDMRDPKRPRKLGQPLTGPKGSVDSLVFSKDGRTLAAAGAEGTVALWDMTDREAPAQLGQPLPTSPSNVTSLAFSPKGHTLAASSFDPDNNEGAVTLWDMTVMTSLRDHGKDRACSHLGSGLPRDQWKLYIPDLPYEQTCPSGRKPLTAPAGGQHDKPTARPQVMGQLTSAPRRR